MTKYYPNNWAKLRLINRCTNKSTPTSLTELIERYSYKRCSALFNGEDNKYIIKGVRK